ncbi:MAG: HlyC/CorC family transporter [Firmicutes bacterium]|nr:HlyC/CorC family transporter [Bacillota bacterium]
MSSDQVPLYLFFIAAILLLNALVVLCNTAFSNANVNLFFQLANDDDDSKEKRAVDVLNKPFRYRYTNRFINYTLIIIGTLLSVMLPYNDYFSAGVFLFLSVTLAELFPRKLGVQHSDTIVRSMGGFQKALILLFTPFVAVVTVVTDGILLLFRQKTKIELNRYSEEEVMSMLEAGQQSGEIKEEGKRMINSIFEFDDELAYEIMTPRTDVFLIDINDSQEEYTDELMKLQYSRIPVCEGESDNIIGILHIKDYLIQARDKGFENVDIRSILRTPYFVPETKNIDALFFELQKEKQHIAILIDEYGGFSGIVTMEDIIEEIVGEIDDEFDEEEFALKKIDDSTAIVNGKTYIDDLNEELDINLESENSETVGGLVMELLGEIPADGDKGRVVEYKNYRFTVLSVADRRIEKIKMEILPPEESVEESED